MSKHKAKPDYIDLDKDGNKKESLKKASKDAKMKPRRKKRIVSESADIKNFIAAISTKKYALAHKYLKQVVEDKISKRISSSLNEPLF